MRQVPATEEVPGELVLELLEKSPVTAKHMGGGNWKGSGSLKGAHLAKERVAFVNEQLPG